MIRIKVSDIVKEQELTRDEQIRLTAGGLSSSPLGFAPRSLKLGAEENGWLRPTTGFGGEEIVW